MNGIFLPSLYVISGVCVFAALHHGLAAMRRRVNRIHILFSLMSAVIAGYVMVRAGGYTSETAAELVTMRRWEVVFVCIFFVLFLQFIAEYTGVRSHKLISGLTLFFFVLFVVTLNLPYGTQFIELPHLSYYQFPWGETVVDMRVIKPTLWHNMAWGAVSVVMGYALYAGYVQYLRGQQQQALALLRSLFVFFAFILFNFVVNRQWVNFIQTSEFGFLAIVVLMDLEMMVESRDQRRRLTAVLDHLPAAICLKDSRGRYQLVNRQFETFFKTNSNEILGKDVFDLFSREYAEKLRANEQLVLSERKEFVGELLLARNAQPSLYESHIFPMLRPDGTVFGMCGVYIDITDSRRKDEALQKLKLQAWHFDRIASTGVITASLAHELCQPLSAILNNAQAGLRFLAKDPVNLDEIRALLEDIVSDDKRAGAVINGLRALLQKQDIPYAEIDLMKCIKDVLDLLHIEFIRLGVESRQQLEPDLMVRANRTQIQQVVLNLVMNALEAIAERNEGPRLVHVRASHVGGKVLVSVCDTGVGIPADRLERIFDGFYTTKPQGLGVGLEVCRSIIDSHNGSIWAENNPEQGAIFLFTLPVLNDAKTNSGMG